MLRRAVEYTAIRNRSNRHFRSSGYDGSVKCRVSALIGESHGGLETLDPAPSTPSSAWGTLIETWPPNNGLYILPWHLGLDLAAHKLQQNLHPAVGRLGVFQHLGQALDRARIYLDRLPGLEPVPETSLVVDFIQVLSEFGNHRIW